MGIGWDIMTGADFVGTDIDWRSPPNVLSYITEESLPFVLEAALLQRPHRSGWQALTGEVFGARGYPTSRSTQRNILRDKYAMASQWKDKDGNSLPWAKLNKGQQRSLDANGDPELIANGTYGQAFPDLAELTQLARKDRVVRGEEIDVEVEEWFGAREENQQEWLDTVNNGYQRVVSGAIDLPHFRKLVMAEASDRRRNQNDENNEQHPKVMDWFEEIRKMKENPDRPEDVAYAEFISEIVAADDLETEFGYDFRERDIRIDAFKDKWKDGSGGDSVFEYVQERLNTGKDVPPIVLEWYNGMNRFGWIWKLPAELVIDKRADSDTMWELYDWYEFELGNNDIKQKAFIGKHPHLKKVIDTISRVRVKARETNQELDAFMFRWGWGGTSTLKHRANIWSATDGDGEKITSEQQIRHYMPKRENWIYNRPW